MTSKEQQAIYGIAGIYVFRMLGLFIILPVFAALSASLQGNTPLLMGIALGGYGITQACLQIPFGMWSDHIGRKPVILIGLLLFVLGSVIAALSHGIVGVIIGRLLQGAGAVGSSLNALLTDLTRTSIRTTAMAIIGITIAFSFFLSMILGPLLTGFLSLSGLFWFTALLALLGIVLLYTLVPQAPPHPKTTENYQGGIAILKNKILLRLNLSVFLLHMILTSLFVALPLVLLRDTHVTSAWTVYVPALLIAFLLVFPLIRILEKKKRTAFALCFAIACLAASQIGLRFFYHNVWGVEICLTLFFTAFSFLEAALPSLVSKVAPPARKGMAMGFFSAAQFLGIFFGGLLGGLLYHHGQLLSIFIFTTIVACFWLIFERLQGTIAYPR